MFLKPYAKQRTFYVLVALYGFLMLHLLVSSVHASNTAYAVFAILLTCPLPLIALRVQESSNGAKLSDSKAKLWLFGIGETLALYGAAAFAAMAWLRMQRGGWMYGAGWVALSMLIGLLVGVAIHWMDVKRYRKLGVANLLSSPVKLARNLMVRVVLISAFICVGAPLLFCAWSGPAMGFMICVGAWCCLGIQDRRRKIDPRDRFAAWDPKNFRRL